MKLTVVWHWINRLTKPWNTKKGKSNPVPNERSWIFHLFSTSFQWSICWLLIYWAIFICKTLNLSPISNFFSMINLLVTDLLNYFQLQDVDSFTHFQLLFNDQFVNHWFTKLFSTARCNISCRLRESNGVGVIQDYKRHASEEGSWWTSPSAFLFYQQHV